jgi:hypothetical protein
MSPGYSAEVKYGGAVPYTTPYISSSIFPPLLFVQRSCRNICKAIYETRLVLARFEFFTAMTMKNAIFFVALVRSDVSEEFITSIIMVKRIGKMDELLVAANAVPNSDSFHPDNGGDKILRNVGPYETHIAPYSRRRHI